MRPANNKIINCKKNYIYPLGLDLTTVLYDGLTRILTQKELQKAIHSFLYNKCHKTFSSFIFHSPNQNLDDFIGSIQVELNLYKDVFIRLQIEITEHAELKVFFKARIISKFNLQLPIKL